MARRSITRGLAGLLLSLLVLAAPPPGEGHPHVFEPDEAAGLEREHFATLRPSGYYTELTLNGASIPVPAARDFRAIVRDQRGIFTFALPLSAARGREGTLALLVEDPDYYCAMAYDALARPAAGQRAGVVCESRRASAVQVARGRPRVPPMTPARRRPGCPSNAGKMAPISDPQGEAP